MIRWRARAHQQCDFALLLTCRTKRGNSGTRRSPAAERRTRHTEEVTYTIDIAKSNLPQWDITPET